jgi:hypothetical protein
MNNGDLAGDLHLSFEGSEDAGTSFSINVGSYIPNCMASHPTTTTTSE